MKKVYAVQIAPECQEPPLFLEGCFHENIILTGNRDYNSQTIPAYNDIVEYFDDMAYQWENYRNEWTLSELLRNYDFERADGKQWSTRQRGQWRKLLESNFDASDDEIILPSLELLTGKKWGTTQISGDCQSDWQNLYYPVDEWSREDIRHFESEYFNTGSEWMIHDGDDEPNCPDEISGYTQYFTDDMDVDDIKAYLASEYGVPLESVILYVYSGSRSVSVYDVA